MVLAGTLTLLRSSSILVSCALLAGAACGSSLRIPPSGPHPETARQIIVDYPPPPARVHPGEDAGDVADAVQRRLQS